MFFREGKYFLIPKGSCIQICLNHRKCRFCIYEIFVHVVVQQMFTKRLFSYKDAHTRGVINRKNKCSKRRNVAWLLKINLKPIQNKYHSSPKFRKISFTLEAEHYIFISTVNIYMQC